MNDLDEVIVARLRKLVSISAKCMMEPSALIVRSRNEQHGESITSSTTSLGQRQHLLPTKERPDILPKDALALRREGETNSIMECELFNS